MKSLAYLALLPLVAGCNVHTKSPDGDNDNVSIHSDQGGNVSFDLPFAKGQVKLPSTKNIFEQLAFGFDRILHRRFAQNGAKRDYIFSTRASRS